MSKMIDQGVDAIEFLTHNQEDRTGIFCARVARSLDRGVDAQALACQMTANERRNNPSDPEVVTEEDVHSWAKAHRLNSRRQAYPKAQAAELERVARESDDAGSVYQS